MIFPEIGLSNTSNSKSGHWMSFPEIWLVHFSIMQVDLFFQNPIPVDGGRFVCQTLVQIMIDWAWMKHKNEMIDQNFRIGEINYLRLLLLSHFRLLQNHVSYYLLIYGFS